MAVELSRFLPTRLVGESPGLASAKSQSTARAEAHPDAATHPSVIAFEKRFPNVEFVFDKAKYTNADIAKAQIGADVQIAPGATVELGPNLKLQGKTQIGATARIGENANITHSEVLGGVSGGTVVDSKIGPRATVTGGQVHQCTLKADSAVHGDDTKVSQCILGFKQRSGGEIGTVITSGAHAGRNFKGIMNPSPGGLTIGDTKIGATRSGAYQSVAAALLPQASQQLIVPMPASQSFNSVPMNSSWTSFMQPAAMPGQQFTNYGYPQPAMSAFQTPQGAYPMPPSIYGSAPAFAQSPVYGQAPVYGQSQMPQSKGWSTGAKVGAGVLGTMMMAPLLMSMMYAGPFGMMALAGGVGAFALTGGRGWQAGFSPPVF